MNGTHFLSFVGCFLAVLVCPIWAWRGNYRTLRKSYTERERYCACYYETWGCSYWNEYQRTVYYTDYQCQPGWTNNGDENCNIPLCRPSCKNGGSCTAVNYCRCPSWSSGPYTGCQTLTCSYKRPCFPGDCTQDSSCDCEPGFLFINSKYGCTRLNQAFTSLRPVVGKSNVTLSHIRRTDNKTHFMFILEGTNRTNNELQIIWINQKRFNNLRFEYETYFQQPGNLPDKPGYISDAKLGVVKSVIEVNVSKVQRDKSSAFRDQGSFQTYQCEGGFSRDNPATEIARCIVNDDQFRTLIEHGDWLNVKFKSDSGGYQKLIDLDNNGQPYATHYYNGLQDVSEVQFNFDFIAPKHCSESGAWEVCPPNATMLKVDKEFTKDPIKVFWLGWTDDLSKVLEYYVEIFKLSPNADNRLVELSPLEPVFTATPLHSAAIEYPVYRPAEPGMYSVLMETRDVANNSRTARRFVLYDNSSTISINKDSALYVSSAAKETGYRWQTPSAGRQLNITVCWSNHFANKLHEEKQLLNAIEEYPIQFKEIQDDGILFSMKFVAPPLDDNDGQRTRKAILNNHGIVKFEIAKEYTLSEEVPSLWETVEPMSEETTFRATLEDGDRVRVWIRATDLMGNSREDNTLLRVDGTPPIISKDGTSEHQILHNVEGGAYNYTTRLMFAASDQQSGVHKIEYTIIITNDIGEKREVYSGFAPAKISEDMSNPYCFVVEGRCFILSQQLDLDNCWFMTMKSELDYSTAEVNVTVYNQALLTAKSSFQIGPVKTLKGLEKYDGPENIRIESPSQEGFRVAWDLPEKTSCYGRAEIVIVLLRKGFDGTIEMETYYTSGSKKYFDILGLTPSTDYQINFGLKTANNSQMTGISLAAKTADPIDAGPGTGVVLGVAIAVVVIVVIAVMIVIILIRKGVIHPPQQVQRAGRAVSRRIRMSMHRANDDEKVATFTTKKSRSSRHNVSSRQSELYIYGGMDMQTPQIWHIERNDVTLDILLKSGHFANIYKARLRHHNSGEFVVAKILKEGFTQDDELAMKAKINFQGSRVGEHPNILKFIGAVVNDDAMGPFIIYEYCENGNLKDFLVANKTNMSIELSESLFSFGLGIAKGMEYLASKEIVHRRLAARNILLTFLNEVKIAGFGPQPDEEDGTDSEQGKRERIPIKWMAPECMSSTVEATEKSDVWSYAVVLWEIFTLGDTPYSCKSRDLPGQLKKGVRLPKPELCDDTWYAVMRGCWQFEPKNRPTFAKIRSELDNLFTAAPGDDYYYYKR